MVIFKVNWPMAAVRIKPVVHSFAQGGIVGLAEENGQA